MWKKILTMPLVLVLVLSFTACTEEAKEAAEEVGLPPVQEIVDGVIEALDNISTYQFDMDMTMDMAGEAEGEAFEMTTVMDSSGALDLDNREMMIDMTMDIALPGEGEMEMGMTMYLIGDMMYIMMETPGMDPTWVKSELPARYWEQMSQTESQAELLKTAQVKVIGSETINGIDSYVFQLTPDMAQLWQLAMQQAAVGGEGVLPDVTEKALQEMFRSFSVKQWIAKDTYYLTKAEIDMAIELTPELMGFSGEEGALTMDISMVLLSHSYNQPVSIVLPPEAEEAIEMPGL